MANGTPFTSGWLPAVGYQQSRELTSASERREHGLAARPRIPSLYEVEAHSADEEARHCYRQGRKLFPFLSLRCPKTDTQVLAVSSLVSVYSPIGNSFVA